MSNAEIFRAYLECFTQGDIAGAGELLDDDFTFEGPILKSTGKAEFLAARAWRRRWRGVARSIASGSTVTRSAPSMTSRLRHHSDRGPIPMAEWSEVRSGKAGVFPAHLRHGKHGRPDASGLGAEMPKAAWTGYGRFCPLARALDIVGDRWTLIIVQELMKRPSRYGELVRRLPGISTSVLAERLRKLEGAGVVKRRVGAVGSGVTYCLTERGLGLAESLQALRRWGVEFLNDPSADGADFQAYDVHYVDGIDALEDGEFGLVVDGRPTTLSYSRGHLEQRSGNPENPLLVVRTSKAFMDRWAAGTVSWDDGVESGEVDLYGSAQHWNRWLAATGYLTAYESDESAA